MILFGAWYCPMQAMVQFKSSLCFAKVLWLGDVSVRTADNFYKGMMDVSDGSRGGKTARWF